MVKVPVDALLVIWRITPEEDSGCYLAASQNFWEKKIQPAEKERTEDLREQFLYCHVMLNCQNKT